jgi:hypothetical protein
MQQKLMNAFGGDRGAFTGPATLGPITFIQGATTMGMTGRIHALEKMSGRASRSTANACTSPNTMKWSPHGWVCTAQSITQQLHPIWAAWHLTAGGSHPTETCPVSFEAKKRLPQPCLIVGQH